MNRAERRRLERETRKAEKSNNNYFKAALDNMNINFEPYKLLTYEEKQKHIKRMLQIPLDELLAGFESGMRKLVFLRDSNASFIMVKARTEEEFIELNAKNISGFEDKKEELIEVVTDVYKLRTQQDRGD